MKTVVLAYSGGLDTSVCIPLLKERYNYDRVITVVADVGQPASEIDDATKRAKTLADEHYTLDLKDEFVNGYIFWLFAISCGWRRLQYLIKDVSW